MKIKIAILGLGITALAASCTKKDLEVAPTTLLTADVTFQNVTDLEAGLLGAYSAFNGDNTMYINAILADEVKISSENRGQGQFEFKWQYSSGTGSFAFETWYGVARRINQVLTVAPKIIAKNAAEETRRQSVIAEALALRASVHFELLQRFGPSGYQPTSPYGVTYVTSVLSPTEKPSRNTVAETIAGIDKDLADAKANANLSNAPQLVANYGNIKASKAYVAGLQARVALYKRDWANAITFSTEAITLSGKTLATGTNFSGIWTDAAATSTEPEVIFRLRRTGTGVGTLWQDINGDVFFEPSDKLKQLFNRTTDFRFNNYFQITPAGPGVDTALVKKFFTSSRGAKIVDVKAMRVAEMYLIRAEARAESNDFSGATTDINTLRAARITGYTAIPNYPDKNTAVADILNERFKELCFEGFRFFDLKRKELPVSRLASDVTSPTWSSLPANNYRFALPIPQGERMINPNQAQNPNY